MPFPQLPSSKDVADTFKGVVIMFVVVLVIATGYGIYDMATSEKRPYVSPKDKFKECLVKGKSQDVCLDEYEREVSDH